MGKGEQPLFRGTSHDPGRNAVVSLYPDRIERIQERKRTSVRSAHQDTEVTPIRAISSVQTTKDGWRTNVTVYASGNNIVFRFEHKEAASFRAMLTQVMNGAVPTAAHQPMPMAAPAQNVPPPAPVHSQPAGWYADPTGRHELRWWGGVSWMDAVKDGDVQFDDPA